MRRLAGLLLLAGACRGYTPEGQGVPSYEAVQRVWNRDCAGSGCHVSAMSPSMLDLSPAVSYASLVGAPSKQAPGRTLVVPGQPQDSYLLCTLQPDCPDLAGPAMPLGGELGPDTIEVIRRWIAAGAPAAADGGLDAPPSFCREGCGLPDDGCCGIESATVLAGAPTDAGVATGGAGAAWVELRWPIASDDRTPPERIVYRVFSAASPGAEDFSFPAATLTGSTSAFLRLDPGRRYYFVVRAVDEDGNEDGNRHEISVALGDRTPPEFGGLVSAQAAGEGAFALAWDPASDDVDAPAAIRYRVYVGAVPQGENYANPVVETAPGATGVTVRGLGSTRTYYFVARAVDSSGNEEANKVERTVAPSDTQPPLFAGLTGISPGPSSMSLSWAPATDDVTASDQIVYLIYRATAPGAEDFGAPVATTPPGVTSYAAGGLAASTTYYFVVRARDLAGNVDANTVELSDTTPNVSDTTPPMFSGVAAATAQGADAIALAWSPATDDVTPPEQIVYLVYRATTSGGEPYGTPTYTTPPGATGFTATGLSPSTTYYFVVRARDAAGNSDTNTREASAVTGADGSPPAFGGLASAVGGSASINLGWSPAVDDTTPSSQITYLVYQATSAGGEDFANPSYTTAPGATSFAATAVAPGTIYYFVVRARDAAGNIDGNTVELSAGLSADVTPPTFAGATSALATSTTSIALAWTAATDNATPSSQIVYLVYQATTSAGENFATPTYTTAAGATGLTVTGLAPSTTYYYVVRAQDQAGNIDSNTAQVSATTQGDSVPPTFAGLESATATNASSVALSWSAASDNLTPASQIVYLVYQAASPGGESYATPSYTTPAGATSFTVSGLAPGSTTYFVVRARDTSGNIDGNTAERSATTPSASISLANDVQPIFTANCALSGCHTGAAPAEGLNLSSASKSYFALVGVASKECPATLRVKAGDPSSSYIVWKLQGSGPCFSGTQMPKTGGALSAAELDTITGWIKEGAPNN